MNQSHGATGWSYVPKRVESRDALSIFNYSMHTLPERAITRSHLTIKFVQYLPPPKRQYVTLGTATTASHCARKIAILQPLSRHGVDIKYCTLPQGYIASVESYSRRFDKIVSNVRNKIKVIDDTLLWSNSIEDCFFRTCEWLDICDKHGIIQNPSKFVFGADTVEFSGFEITPTNVRPSPNLMKAIADFPTPTNITDVRSWFGLVNQVTYAFSMTDKMAPFRQLLKPQTAFYWDNQLDQLFIGSKSKILGEIKPWGTKSLTKRKPHASQQIGRKPVLASGCFRSTANVLEDYSYVAPKAEKWL